MNQQLAELLIRKTVELCSLQNSENQGYPDFIRVQIDGGDTYFHPRDDRLCDWFDDEDRNLGALLNEDVHITDVGIVSACMERHG